MKNSKMFDGSGYHPLRLPAKGEELIVDRQYALTPVSRLVIEEMYGLKNVPTFVTCIKIKVAKTRVTRIIENLETGEVFKSIQDVEPQEATFTAFLSLRNRMLFTLDLARVKQAEAIYADSPKLTKYEESDELAKPTKKTATGKPTKVRVPVDLSIFD